LSRRGLPWTSAQLPVRRSGTNAMRMVQKGQKWWAGRGGAVQRDDTKVVPAASAELQRFNVEGGLA